MTNCDTLNKSDPEFYEKAVSYWSEIPATVDGMLGGFGYISATDIQGSKTLLKQIFHMNDPPGKEYCLDCGAGIGRCTKYLLTCYFEKTDMVEQNAAFLEQSKAYLGKELLNKKIGQQYPVGLQDFDPEPGKYDLIWNQWVLGHLTNDDLVEYFKRCQKGLKPNGVIVVKENITSNDSLELDKTDSSFTRSKALFKVIFEKAGLCVAKELKQNNFPKGLFAVQMFVLKPIKRPEVFLENQSLELLNKVESKKIISQNSHCNVEIQMEQNVL